VTAIFTVSPGWDADRRSGSPTALWLAEYGLAGTGEAEIILRREIQTGGRSRLLVNDQPVTLAAVKDLARSLVEVHTNSHALARLIPVDFLQKLGDASCWISKGELMTGGKEDILRGTLGLLVLKTLDTLGPLHGYGIARRIEQMSENLLYLNQGTLYPALLRLEQKGWISSKWGTSDNNRRARYYALTKAGRKQLAREARSWERMAGMIGRLLEGTEG
jgi:PadR family transcriptional regulator, regulatory protein PadR